MSYEPYASPGYYQGKYEGTLIEDDHLKKALVQASRHIDSLTYNRIVGRGFSNLTRFQQDIICLLYTSSTGSFLLMIMPDFRKKRKSRSSRIHRKVPRYLRTRSKD